MSGPLDAIKRVGTQASDGFKKVSIWDEIADEAKRPGERAAKKTQKADEAQQASKDVWDGIDLPDIQPIELQGPELADNYTPVESEYTPQGESAYNGITVDPMLKAAQDRSLSSLDEIIQGGGMTAADRANIAKDQSLANQQDKGRRDAILQNQEARGMGGSGNSLLAQLQSSQAATDRNSQTGLDINGMAQQRAMDAIAASGKMSGGMIDQQFGQAATVAGANDAVSKFNAGNTLQNTQYNAGAQNQALASGVDRQQGVNNAKATAANNTQLTNQGIPQQQFQNNVTVAGGKTGVNTQIAETAEQRAARIKQEQAAIYGGIVQGGSAIASAAAGKPPVK